MHVTPWYLIISHKPHLWSTADVPSAEKTNSQLCLHCLIYDFGILGIEMVQNKYIYYHSLKLGLAMCDISKGKSDRVYIDNLIYF